MKETNDFVTMIDLAKTDSSTMATLEAAVTIAARISDNFDKEALKLSEIYAPDLMTLKGLTFPIIDLPKFEVLDFEKTMSEGLKSLDSTRRLRAANDHAVISGKNREVVQALETGNALIAGILERLGEFISQDAKNRAKVDIVRHEEIILLTKKNGRLATIQNVIIILLTALTLRLEYVQSHNSTQLGLMQEEIKQLQILNKNFEINKLKGVNQ